MMSFPAPEKQQSEYFVVSKIFKFLIVLIIIFPTTFLIILHDLN